MQLVLYMLCSIAPNEDLVDRGWVSPSSVFPLPAFGFCWAAWLCGQVGLVSVSVSFSQTIVSNSNMLDLRMRAYLYAHLSNYLKFDSTRSVGQYTYKTRQDKK